MTIRQGDILLRSVAAPDPATRQDGAIVDRIVLAEGEATGHAHVVEGSVIGDGNAAGFSVHDGVEHIGRLHRRGVRLAGCGDLALVHRPGNIRA